MDIELIPLHEAKSLRHLHLLALNPEARQGRQPLDSPDFRHLEESLYDFDEPSCDDTASLSILDVFTLDPVQNGFEARLSIAPTYFPVIVGRGGATKRQLENETRCTVFIPAMGREGDLVISGSSKSSVESCCRRMILRVVNARQRQTPTHILTLRCTDARSKFDEFRTKVLERVGDKSRGLDASIFQNPSRLHFTLGMMALMSEKERQVALRTLQECELEVVRPFMEEKGSVSFRLRGLEYLNDDPGEVDVLYAKMEDESENLHLLVSSILDFFDSRGLLIRQRDEIKFHVTLINTLFRGGKDERATFDAVPILEDTELRSFDFGEVAFKTVNISQRFHFDKDGYYYSIATLCV